MNCARDEGWPIAIAEQVVVANHALLLHYRDVVISELGKGRCRNLSGESRRVECKRIMDDVSKVLRRWSKPGKDSSPGARFVGACFLANWPPAQT